MNVTYEIDSLSSLKDNWNDLFTYNISDKDIPGGHKHDKDKDCKKGCKCDPKKTKKETQKQIQKMRNQVLKEVIKLIENQESIDINKVVDAVIKKQKPHEDNQTHNINKNQQDINDLNNITIWDKDGPFN